MVDLEYIANKALSEARGAGGEGRAKAVKELAASYIKVKGFSPDTAEKFAEAVVSEVELSRTPPRHPAAAAAVTQTVAGITAGYAGLGSRGSGDFIVHRIIAEIAHSANTKSSVPVVLEPLDHDDAGAVEVGSAKIVLAAVDGAHSRLSGFPFLMGFHDARAALRDVCVKGARPVALLDDVHLADDGDVAKIFDFVAGVAAVSESTGVPLISGSTLRVGGDMVLGDRLVGAVCAVGVVEDNGVNDRSRVEPGDVVVMTEGSGGGTVSATAIYSGNPDVVAETLNIDFFKASAALSGHPLASVIHCVTDVTNGGIRGDLESIAAASRVRVTVDEESIESAVKPGVLRLLRKLEIDPLGLALDSLLIFTPRSTSGRVLDALASVGVRACVVGEASRGRGVYIVERGGGKAVPLKPKFRESAYTGIKKLVETLPHPSEDELSRMLESAAQASLEKKRRIVELIR